MFTSAFESPHTLGYQGYSEMNASQSGHKGLANLLVFLASKWKKTLLTLNESRLPRSLGIFLLKLRDENLFVYRSSPFMAFRPLIISKESKREQY